ncbi:hypothetical protein BaRGS_00004603 [Batillaria attramentaria]|uniref:Uncharacterized protein n=1 Tax=Batillaria attramentaria TaxID=370345 RepID=A0ABD0LXI8_9CAEN
METSKLTHASYGSSRNVFRITADKNIIIHLLEQRPNKLFARHVTLPARNVVVKTAVPAIHLLVFAYVLGRDVRVVSGLPNKVLVNRRPAKSRTAHEFYPSCAVTRLVTVRCYAGNVSPHGDTMATISDFG